jgi:hypothetical protein
VLHELQDRRDVGRVAGEMLSIMRRTMNVNIKTKIRYKGQEYSDVSELPAEARAAMDKAIATGAVRERFAKITLNGQEVAGGDQNVQKLYDDVMKVIENNGEVTLPSSRSSDPLIAKTQIVLVAIFVSALVLGVWLFLVNR